MSSELTCASVAVENHVAVVTLAATGKANRMGPDFWRQMPALFEGLDADAAVRAVVLRGAQDHFSYGIDLAGMAGELAPYLAPDARASERTQLLHVIRRMQDAISAVARCRKPVIAAVHGWCIGGALDLITACDIRLCSADARFSVREVRVAMVADVGSLARLPQIVGQGVARELAFTGDDVDAPRALRLGLVNEVFPTAAQLFEAALALAGRIARNPPLVVQGIKEVLNATSERQARDSLDTVALWNSAFLPSEDLQEAMVSFMEKREPTFQGR